MLYHFAGKVYIRRGKHKPAEVDTSQLGSTIMESMLKEVSDFCNPLKRNNWSDSTRQQVLYAQEVVSTYYILRMQDIVSLSKPNAVIILLGSELYLVCVEVYTVCA